MTKNRAMSKINQDVENEIIYNTEVSKSDLYDFNDAHIYWKVIVGNIAARVTFKSCAPFIKCITKTGRTIIDDAKDLDLVMPL